jgi:glutathione S-transferase
MSKKIELISFKLCPFVQRSVITLLEKNIDFDITYIELSNKPDWFLKISPFGKVPVLKINDSVLFESSVINEYLDEITPPSIHPKDPLKKAINRAWIEFGSNLTSLSYYISIAKDEDEYNKRRDEIIKNFVQLEDILNNSNFFNNDDFSLIDSSYAPFFMRLFYIEKLKNSNILADFPKIKNWSENLLSRDSVKKSVVEDFEDIYNDYLLKNNSFITIK